MANKRGSGTRLVIEKGAQAPTSDEEQDNIDRRASKLAELIERLGGKGRAKVYRVVDGIADPQYAVTWPVDADMSDNLEERLAELGGGKYAVKLYWGAKCQASLTISVDALSHPVKKTEAEQRREGGVLPQTPAELAAFVSQSIGASLAPLMAALSQPRNDGRDDLVKLMLLNSQQQATEARELNAKLLEGLFSRANAPAAAAADPKGMLRDVAETVRLVDEMRGEGGGVRDPRDDKRSLASKLIEGPAEKAAIRMADRVIDKFFEDDDAEGKKTTPAKIAPARVAATTPTAATAATPAARPSQLPTPTPTTPVQMPRGVKGLAPADFARMRNKPSAPAAPRAADAVPSAVTKG